MRKPGSLFAGICLLLLAGCNTANMAYNNAPRFVASEFEDAFDLNSDQSTQLDSRLRQFFAWHRKEELGRYRQLLERAALDVEDGLSAEEFARIVDEIRDAWDRSMARVIDNIGGLGATLSAEQIEHFQAYYDESQQEYDEYFALNPEERRRERAENSLERLEGWYGGFDNATETRVLTRLMELPNAYEPWLKYRDTQIREMIRIFSATRDAAGIQAKLRHLLLDRSNELARGFEPTRTGYWRAYGQALEEIGGWLTPEQHRKAAARLQKYARMVSGITPQG